MGDWVWRDGRWAHLPQVATPVTAADYDPSATRVDIPAVAPMGRIDFHGAVDWAWPPDHDTFTHDDGSVYERLDPDEFDSFDNVDSTTIVDDGGPD